MSGGDCPGGQSPFRLQFFADDGILSAKEVLMMLYLRSFTFPSQERESFNFHGARRQCYNTAYPFGVLCRFDPDGADDGCRHHPLWRQRVGQIHHAECDGGQAGADAGCAV